MTDFAKYVHIVFDFIRVRDTVKLSIVKAFSDAPGLLSVRADVIRRFRFLPLAKLMRCGKILQTIPIIVP